MSRKSLIYLLATIGGLAGGYVPALWGGSEFSGWAIILSSVGAILGVVLAVRLT